MVAKNKKIRVWFLLYLIFSSVDVYAHTLTTTDSYEATAYNNARRLARDSAGNLYVAISANGKIKCFKHDGIEWYLQKEFPQRNAKYPCIYIDKDNNIYNISHLVFSADADGDRGCIFYSENLGPAKNLSKEINLNNPNIAPPPAIDTFYPSFTKIAGAEYISWNKIIIGWELGNTGYCYYSPIEGVPLTTVVDKLSFLYFPPIISAVLGTSTVNLIWSRAWNGEECLFHRSDQTETFTLSTVPFSNFLGNASALMGVDDKLHVVWEEDFVEETHLGTQTKRALMYACLDGGTWSKATVSTTDVGQAIKIEIIPEVLYYPCLIPCITQDINGTVYVVWAEKEKEDENYYVFYSFKEDGKWKPKIKATHTRSADPIYFVNVAQRSSELLIDMVYTTGTGNKYAVVYDNLKVKPSIMITEISPSGYVELHNTLSHPLNLENYRLNIWNVATVTFTGTINPHSSIVIATQATAFHKKFGYYPDFEVEKIPDNLIPDVSISGTFDIRAAGGAILLYEKKDAKWKLIDVVAWGDAPNVVKGVYSIFSTARVISPGNSLQREVSFEDGIPVYRDTEFCEHDFYEGYYHPQTGGTIRKLKIVAGNAARIKAGDEHLFKLQTQNIAGAAIQESFPRTITFIVQAYHPDPLPQRKAKITKNGNEFPFEGKVGEKVYIEDIFGSCTINFSYYDECSGYQRQRATVTAFEFKIEGPVEWKEEYRWQPDTFRVYVEPAGLHHFVVLCSPQKPITYQTATFTIEGYDRFGNFQYDYTGTVNLECISTYVHAYPVRIDFATTTLRCIEHYGTFTVGTPTYSPNMGIGTIKVWSNGTEGTTSALFLINPIFSQEVHYIDRGTETVILEVGTPTFNEPYYVCIENISSPWALAGHVPNFVYKITAKNAANELLAPNLIKPATITFQYYKDEELPEVHRVREADLQIFWWDEGVGVWRETKKTYHCTPTNTIKATVLKLGKYVLGLKLKPAERLMKVIVYPNPYKLHEVKRRRIVFGNPHDQSQRLTERATIRIYNIAGELLHTIEAHAPEGIYVWENPEEKLASGVYFYHITAPDGRTCWGKFSIIK